MSEERHYPSSRSQHPLLLEKYGAYCQGCGRNFSGKPSALEVDHIRPKSDDGTDAFENLTLLCPACNRTKSDKMTLTGLQLHNRREGVLLPKNEANLKLGRGANNEWRAAFMEALQQLAQAAPEEWQALQEAQAARWLVEATLQETAPEEWEAHQKALQAAETAEQETMATSQEGGITGSAEAEVAYDSAFNAYYSATTALELTAPGAGDTLSDAKAAFRSAKTALEALVPDEWEALLEAEAAFRSAAPDAYKEFFKEYWASIEALVSDEWTAKTALLKVRAPEAEGVRRAVSALLRTTPEERGAVVRRAVSALLEAAPEEWEAVETARKVYVSALRAAAGKAKVIDHPDGWEWQEALLQDAALQEATKAKEKAWRILRAAAPKELAELAVLTSRQTAPDEWKLYEKAALTRYKEVIDERPYGYKEEVDAAAAEYDAAAARGRMKRAAPDAWAELKRAARALKRAVPYEYAEWDSPIHRAPCDEWRAYETAMAALRDADPDVYQAWEKADKALCEETVPFYPRINRQDWRSVKLPRFEWDASTSPLQEAVRAEWDAVRKGTAQAEYDAAMDAAEADLRATAYETAAQANGVKRAKIAFETAKNIIYQVVNDGGATRAKKEKAQAEGKKTAAEYYAACRAAWDTADAKYKAELEAVQAKAHLKAQAPETESVERAEAELKARAPESESVKRAEAALQAAAPEEWAAAQSAEAALERARKAYEAAMTEEIRASAALQFAARDEYSALQNAWIGNET